MQKWIYIALGVVALGAIVATIIVVTKNKKDNEASVLAWISSPTA